MKKKQIIISVVVALIVILGVVLFIVFGSAKKEDTEKETPKAEETSTEVVEETADLHTGQVRSLLTGEYVDEKIGNRRPVAVMYNNIIDAIPHSGLSSASVCYEAPVEGCITRIMGIFENYDDLKKIGSIRSSRIYYCYFALEWDAIYVHFGQSKYALDFLKSDKIDNVGAYQSIANTIFFRTSDRVAPHNCFIDGDGIKAGIKDLEYRKKYKDGYTAHFQFADVDTKTDLTSNKIANKVELGYQINKPWFEYDAATGLYKRFQYGEAHIDEQNNEQISCSNIIIQCVDSTIFPDNKSLNITLTGSGSGWYITNGKAEKITWNKTDELGRTTYLDKSGNELVLNNGKTWICIVQNEYSDNIKISK